MLLIVAGDLHDDEEVTDEDERGEEGARQLVGVDESPRQPVPRHELADDSRDAEGRDNEDDRPEDHDAVVAGRPPGTHRGTPAGVQHLLLQHHVCDLRTEEGRWGGGKWSGGNRREEKEQKEERIVQKYFPIYELLFFNLPAYFFIYQLIF